MYDRYNNPRGRVGGQLYGTICWKNKLLFIDDMSIIYQN